MDKTFKDDCNVWITPDQWAWLATTEVGLDRFRDTTGNDAEVFPWVTFGRLVEYLIEQTDLLIEHKNLIDVPIWRWIER